MATKKKDEAPSADANEDSTGEQTEAATDPEPETAPKATKEKAVDFEDVIDEVVEAFGLTSKDVLSTNDRTRAFVLSNGGKYQVARNGRSIRHLAGPNIPEKKVSAKVIDGRFQWGAAARLNTTKE